MLIRKITLLLAGLLVSAGAWAQDGVDEQINQLQQLIDGDIVKLNNKILI